MSDCPACQGEVRTLIEDGHVWVECPNCGLRWMETPALPELPEVEEIDVGEAEDSVMIMREGSGQWFRGPVARRILDICRDNGIRIQELPLRYYNGGERRAYAIDALTEEWVAIQREAVQ